VTKKIKNSNLFIIMAAVNLKLKLDIGKAIQKFVGNIHARHWLDRKTIIRSLLRHCRDTEPAYNVVIFEAQNLFTSFDEADDIYEEEIEMQDFLTKFKFTVCLFKKGTLTVVHGIHDGARWGILTHYN